MQLLYILHMYVTILIVGNIVKQEKVFMIYVPRNCRYGDYKIESRDIHKCILLPTPPACHTDYYSN